jgi:hypothetical protein
MKTISILTHLAVIGICFAPAHSQAATPWTICGTVSQFTTANGGTIPGYSPLQNEYAIAYNQIEPVPVISTLWNQGIRIQNKEPYFVNSDNPLSGMKRGGFVLYKGTQASDDNCPSGGLRHRYWYIAPDNTVNLGLGGNGCLNNTPVYCRLR